MCGYVGTIPSHVGTSIPSHVGTSIPSNVGTSIPSNVGTGIPSNVGTSIPSNVDLTRVYKGLLDGWWGCSVAKQTCTTVCLCTCPSNLRLVCLCTCLPNSYVQLLSKFSGPSPAKGQLGALSD